MQRIGLSSLDRSLRRFGGAVVVAVVVLGPWVFGGSTFRLGQTEYILSLVLISIGLNLATGYAGQLTLGPGATFVAAAYAAAIFANHNPHQATLLLLIAIGAAVAVIVGLIIGLPALRVGGFYLAIVTLFVAIVIPEYLSTVSWAGGQEGISLVSNPRFNQTIHGRSLYEIMAVLVLVVVAAVWALMDSRVGRRFLAIRTSEDLAASLGITVYSTKLLAFAASSVPSGIGGAVYVYSQQFVSPGSADANLSIYLVAACILGGFGTTWGPVVGTLIIFELQQRMGGLQEYLPIVFGGVLLVFTLGLPRGIVGLGRSVVDRLTGTGREEVESDSAGPTTAIPETSLDSPVSSTGFKPSSDVQSPLVVTGVSRHFAGVQALSTVSLTVQPGTIHGLIGSNGSGKTTLLNSISGYGRAQAGDVSIEDQRIDLLSPSRIARLGVARTFQTPKLMDQVTVLDNVMVAADSTTRASGIESFLHLPRGRRADRDARSRALESLRLFGLLSWSNTSAALIPHGTRRLVEVARAAASRPRFVLLDEPAAGLSVAEKNLLGAAIRMMADAGIGVLLIEHNISFVFALANEVTVLHRGSVIVHDTPANVAKHEEVIASYLGSSHAQGQSDIRTSANSGHDVVERSDASATRIGPVIP